MIQTIFKRILLVICGFVIAVAFTIFPIIGFGFFFGTPLILMCIAVHLMVLYIKGKKADKDDIKQGLELAFMCTFGGIAYGVSFIKEHWEKTAP